MTDLIIHCFFCFLLYLFLYLHKDYWIQYLKNWKMEPLSESSYSAIIGIIAVTQILYIKINAVRLRYTSTMGYGLCQNFLQVRMYGV